LLRALATFAAVGLPATIIFAPQGLEARDLVRAMHGTPPLRAAVWLGWLALSTYATNTVFTAPGLTALRVARPRRGHVLAALLALASFAQLPWALMWLRGSGPTSALGAVTVAVAAASSAFAFARRRRPLVGFVLVLALSTAALDLPSALQALVGCILSAIAVDGAWRAGLEHRTNARSWTRPTASPLVAIATVYLLRLARAERLRVMLATMIGSIGAAGLLTLRSEPSPRPFGRALAIMAIPLVLGSALFVAPLIDCERQMRASFRVRRVRRSVVALAFLLAIAAPTSAFAATAGVGAGIAAGVPAPSLGGALGTWAVVLSGIVGAWGRRHDRTEQRSPVLFACGVALIALASVTIAMELP
jgi:hypothetical protein